MKLFSKLFDKTWCAVRELPPSERKLLYKFYDSVSEHCFFPGAESRFEMKYHIKGTSEINILMFMGRDGRDQAAELKKAILNGDYNWK